MVILQHPKLTSGVLLLPGGCASRAGGASAKSRQGDAAEFRREKNRWCRASWGFSVRSLAIIVPLDIVRDVRGTPIVRNPHVSGKLT